MRSFDDGAGRGTVIEFDVNWSCLSIRARDNCDLMHCFLVTKSPFCILFVVSNKPDRVNGRSVTEFWGSGKENLEFCVPNVKKISDVLLNERSVNCFRTTMPFWFQLTIVGFCLDCTEAIVL